MVINTHSRSCLRILHVGGWVQRPVRSAPSLVPNTREQTHKEAHTHTRCVGWGLLTSEGVEVKKGSAVGASMGVSMAGIYHSDTSVLDMTGVVSPVYLLNGIGAVLTRKGEGLFGFAYRLRGTAEAPEVKVNPLSILTPGMFRDLFRAPPPTLNEGGG